MSTNQPRKPAGVPTGGQWAPTAHDEADIELGPTMTEYPDRARLWFQHGWLHRTDGPAIERADGSREWWVKGRHHSDDGPAVE